MRDDLISGSFVAQTCRFGQSVEIVMNDETFNLSIRKFLKMVGVNSQREIEQAAAKAIVGRMLEGNASLPATMTLDVPGLRLSVKFEGEICLD
jgi:Family of unknown function (DUF6494)